MAKKTVKLTVGDNELECEGEYTPAQAGSEYTKNGDPGSPPEASDFVLDTVNLIHEHEGHVLKISVTEMFLTLSDFDVLQEMCLERLEDEDGAEYDDYEDEPDDDDDFGDEEEEEDMGDDADFDDDYEDYEDD